MSANAAVCPHCGSRQSDRDMVDPARVSPAARAAKRDLRLSSEEARALVSVQAGSYGKVQDPRPRGPMLLLLPRAEASGPIRALEWALTVFALPMMVGGLLVILGRPRMWRHVGDGSELGLSLAAALFGTLGIWALGVWTELSSTAIWGVVGASLGGLFARFLLRRTT